MKTYLILLLLACSFSVNAQQSVPLGIEECTSYVPFGRPSSSKQNTTVICRKGYILEHDNKAKIPAWVSYVLMPEHTIGCIKRSNAFAPDMSLPFDFRSSIKDYAKSGYDIGHLANGADMAWDIVVEKDSFILSNMTPQLPGFNRGIWKKLEDQTRAFSKNRNHNLLIYVGPIYNYTQDKIIGNNVIVPHAFFKIIIDLETNEIIVTKFVHESSNAKLSTFITSLSQIQQDTGIAFPMPKNGKFSTEMWTSSTRSVRASKGLACSN